MVRFFLAEAWVVFYSLLLTIFLSAGVPFLALAQGAPPLTPYQPALGLDGKALAHVVAKSLAAKPLSEGSFRTWKITTDMLQGGWPSRYHGYEDELEKLDRWVLAQPDRSIGLETFYSKCFEVADFQLQRGLALAWNYLSQGWEHVFVRNLRPESLKFVDITGELAVFDGAYHFRPVVDRKGQPVYDRAGALQIEQITTKRGDNRGAWYHFAGTALAAHYYSTKAINLRKPWFTYAMIWREAGKFPVSSGSANRKRLNIDRAGADFGFHLSRSFEVNGDSIRLKKSVAESHDVVQPLRPDLYGEGYVLAAGQRPQDWNSALREDNPVLESRAYLEAWLRVYHDAGRMMVLNPVRLMTSSDGARLLRLLRRYQQDAQSDHIDKMLADVLARGVRFDVHELDARSELHHLPSNVKPVIMQRWSEVLTTIADILKSHRDRDEVRARRAELDLAGFEDMRIKVLAHDPQARMRTCESIFLSK